MFFPAGNYIPYNVPTKNALLYFKLIQYDHIHVQKEA